jgi:hypothetical protein
LAEIVGGAHRSALERVAERAELAREAGQIERECAGRALEVARGVAQQ